MTVYTIATLTLSVITALFLLLSLSTGFRLVDKQASACDVNFAFTTTHTLAMGAIEDSHDDESFFNIPLGGKGVVHFFTPANG